MKLLGRNISVSSLTAGIILGVATASFILPKKVEIREIAGKEKIVYRDRTTTKVVTKVAKPDGTTIVVEKDVATDVVKDVDKRIAEKITLKSTPQNPRYGISILAGGSARDPSRLSYGLSAEVRLFGPVWLGVFGMSDLSGGVGIGFKF